MGHSIQYYTFDINKDKKEILAIVNEDAIYNSDNRSELPSPIRYIENKVYEDEEAAMEAIENLDKGWYDQLAVKFYSYKKAKETKTISNLKVRIETHKTNLETYKNTNAIKNRKSQFAGCSNCGSKINKEYINDYGYNWNKCPLCNEDLSSNTVKKSIESKIAKIEEMSNSLKEMIKENNKKGAKTTKWLVKTEFHV